jgi:ABC-type antimicrobial peptide transport system permease subunit
VGGDVVDHVGVVVGSEVALALAAVGIYGVMAYAVTQRTHEIGVRVALGATPGEIAVMVMKEGARLAAVGTIVGGIGALVLARALATLLFGVRPADPIAFAIAAGSVLIMTLVATYVPSRRATRVDPVAALRAE